jgi:phenylalanyl-tRNA synthetase beta chain
MLAGREHPVTHDRASAPVDMATAKGLLEHLAARLIAGRLSYQAVAAREGVEHPGRAAGVTAVDAAGDATLIGRVGDLHPRLLAAFDVRAEHVVFAEIDLAAFAGLVPERIRVGRLQRLPGIERDLALVVAAEQPAGEVEALIRAHGGPHLRSVRLFDQYRGAPLTDSQKSLAYRLRFEPIEGALIEEDVDDAVERVVTVTSERLGARLRG